MQEPDLRRTIIIDDKVLYNLREAPMCRGAFFTYSQ
jgi:hypothetical protein